MEGWHSVFPFLFFCFHPSFACFIFLLRFAYIAWFYFYASLSFAFDFASTGFFGFASTSFFGLTSAGFIGFVGWVRQRSTFNFSINELDKAALSTLHPFTQLVYALCSFSGHVLLKQVYLSCFWFDWLVYIIRKIWKAGNWVFPFYFYFFTLLLQVFVFLLSFACIA